MIEGIEIETSSGNVFTDLVLPDAAKLKIKSGLVIEIARAVRRLGYENNIQVLLTAESVWSLTLAIVLNWCFWHAAPWEIGHNQATAGLAGALFGGAALLLGNWINRASKLKAVQEQASQIEKLKSLIPTELVDVA